MVGAGDWYVARDGQVTGPFSFDELLSQARNGGLSPSDLVWPAEGSAWKAANEVPGLWLPPELPAVNPVKAEDEGILELCEEQAIKPAPDAAFRAATLPVKFVPASAGAHKPNFIVRHWRGDLSLAWSYWGVGALLTIALLLATRLYGSALSEASLSPASIGLAMLILIASLTAITVWQFVGVWRSAGKQIKRGKRTYWGIIARFAVIVGVLRAGGEMVTVTGPMASHSLRLIMGEEHLPNYQIRLLRNATEIELSGGMRFGVADEMRKVLDAAPTVKLIHLNSIGGLLTEGFKLRALIKERALITYTSSNCLSACTLVFTAGRQRYLANGAKLGFHSSSFGSLDQKQMPEINLEVRRALAQEGAPAWFLDKALSTSSKDLWYPTQEELLKARVVTKIVDSSQFAISGLQRIEGNEVESVLSRFPVYGIIKEVEPDAYARITQKIGDGIKAGQSIIELQNSIGAILQEEIIPKYVRLAPDRELLAYFATQIREMEYLLGTDPKLCTQLLFPEMKGATFDLEKLAPKDVLQSDLDALANLIREGARNPIRDESQPANEELAGVVKRVSVQIPDAADLLLDPKKYIDRPASLCRAFILTYKDILTLPEHQSGRMLRFLLTSGDSPAEPG